MDAFDGDSIDAQWGVSLQSDAVVDQANGHLVVEFADAPSPDTYGGVYSVNEYNLTDCAVFTSVVTVPDPATHAYVQLVVSTDVGYVEVLKDGDNLDFKSYVDSAFTVYDSVPYDPVMHRFWRIREAEGMTYWETSPDAQSWEIGASEPSPIPLAAVYIGVAGGTYQIEPIPPGEIHFDGVNVSP